MNTATSTALIAMILALNAGESGVTVDLWVGLLIIGIAVAISILIGWWAYWR